MAGLFALGSPVVLGTPVVEQRAKDEDEDAEILVHPRLLVPTAEIEHRPTSDVPKALALRGPFHQPVQRVFSAAGPLVVGRDLHPRLGRIRVTRADEFTISSGPNARLYWHATRWSLLGKGFPEKVAR